MTSSEISSEIEREQAHVDRAYDRLEELRAEARASAARVAATTGTGTAQALWEREAMFSERRSRFVALTIGDAEPLIFGRIDTTDAEGFHVGRVGVTDTEHNRLVVDWRAPAAAAFYRATPADPQGVVRRRHLHCRGRCVLGLDDELLDASSEASEGMTLVGEAALLRAVGRTRTGRMRDIVATIQAEQDVIVRAPLEGVLVVQGGPGTGKTAVGLHRAAYLLYTHRHRLERSGVLLVGPDPVFLRYVEHVLPSLGEGSVRLATTDELVAGVKVRATDPARGARVKGDARMVKVLRRAVRYRQRGLDKPVRILHDGEVLELDPQSTRRIVGEVQKMRGTHNERRRSVVMGVLMHLLDLYRAELARSEKAGTRGPAPWGTKIAKQDRVDFFEAMLDEPGVREAIDDMWPLLSPQRALAELLTSPQALRHACARVLSDEERDALARDEHQGWSAGDVALLDELSVLLGPHQPGRPETPAALDEEERWTIERMLDDLGEVDPIISAERGWLTQRYLEARSELEDGERRVVERKTYGHVIVDEAQDLSPMQWRMISRRCPSGSMTILGDLAQASGAWTPSDWEEALSSVRVRRGGVRGGAARASSARGAPPEIKELTINYRTPSEIMSFADRLVDDVASRRPQSVREGEAPVVDRVGPDELIDAVVGAVRRERAETEGTVAVVAPSPVAGELAARLEVTPGDLDAPVVVIDPRRAKGLEFDVVVVCEPGAIAAEAGRRGLYVVCTRPTQRLLVFHAEDLPPELQPTP